MAVPPVPPGFPWIIVGQGTGLWGHSHLLAEHNPRESVPLCCDQAVEMWMYVGLIILQGECFLGLKYKWPSGKEIIMKIKTEPEHSS